MSSDYFVYLLEDEIGSPFYVGSAKMVADPRYPHNTRYWGHVISARNALIRGKQVEKNKILVRMLDAGLMPRYREIAAGLTEADGYALERKLIAKIGRLILGTGPLTNIHGGGMTLSSHGPLPTPGFADVGMAALAALRRTKLREHGTPRQVLRRDAARL